MNNIPFQSDAEINDGSQSTTDNDMEDESSDDNLTDTDAKA
jgi:hypothetical protein